MDIQLKKHSSASEIITFATLIDFTQSLACLLSNFPSVAVYMHLFFSLQRHRSIFNILYIFIMVLRI